MRTVEARARESNAAARWREELDGAELDGAGAQRHDLHPDQEQAAREIAEALSGALGAEVRVKPTHDGSYRAELEFATPEEALEPGAAAVGCGREASRKRSLESSARGRLAQLVRALL